MGFLAAKERILNGEHLENNWCEEGRHMAFDDENDLQVKLTKRRRLTLLVFLEAKMIFGGNFYADDVL